MQVMLNPFLREKDKNACVVFPALQFLWFNSYCFIPYYLTFNRSTGIKLILFNS